MVLSLPVNPALAQYLYERGQDRFKHVWKKDEAGFNPQDGEQVGKCHSSIDDTKAEELLRSGVPVPNEYDDEGATGAPDKIYNVYQGVPYVAVPTTPGKSFHGYPWSGRMPRSVKNVLEQRAKADGRLREFRRWLKKYGTQ